jgi:branched-chain amino acid transport system permease protein
MGGEETSLLLPIIIEGLRTRQTMTLDLFFQHLMNGISLGGTYALIAIGYTMVYGILRLINFAHGDVFMMAGYFAFYSMAIFLLPWYVAFVLAIVLAALLGVLVERVAYRPLRDAPRISTLLSAIGVSMLMENFGFVVFSGIAKAFPRPAIFAQQWSLGRVRFLSLTVFTIVVSLAVLLATLYLVFKTKVGRAMRAVSRDMETAGLMGINVNQVIPLTFLIGSALAAVGALTWSIKFPVLVPDMGVVPGLKCFIAAVVGGIGSIPGALLGGLLLGLAEILIVAFFPAISGYKYAIAYTALILVLLVKPTGLMGRAVEEKA